MRHSSSPGACFGGDASRIARFTFRGAPTCIKGYFSVLCIWLATPTRRQQSTEGVALPKRTMRSTVEGSTVWSTTAEKLAL